MVTTETRLKNKCIDHMKAMRKSGEEVFWVKAHGTPMQRAGIPDLICVYRGRTIWVELKAPRCKPTRLQREIGGRIQRAGGNWFVVRELYEFIDTLTYLKGAEPRVESVQAI